MSSSGKEKQRNRESRSAGYIIGSSFLAALMLGLTAFFLISGYQWRNALTDLRAEPGVEVIKVERIGFIKRRLLGLRDPLAPSIENILSRNGIAPHTVEIALTEYHSLNTTYALRREQEARDHSDLLQDALSKAVGKFAEAVNAKRDEDIEQMTRMLLDAKYPETMQKVNLQWHKGNWNAQGELYAPELETFASEAPSYILEGNLNLGELVDLTHRRCSALENDIGSTNLLSTDLDGNLVHIERMSRLVSEYDKVCELSDLSQPPLRLEIHAANPQAIHSRTEDIRNSLTLPDRIDSARFVLDAIVHDYSDSGPAVYLKLLPGHTP
tara:strand:- start:583 stop:1560 length:978 start_codon:yes stop_codon:yes gene_type:complete